MNKLVEHIKSLRETATGIASPDYFRELDELEEKLKEEKLYLVVVGLFKRGKSSVINAILGKPLAPVAVTPVTAIITLFEYDARRHYVNIRFNDGRVEEGQTDEVSRYVNEDENPENKKQVQLVSIYDDAPILKTVSLVDTPGIGSNFKHNTATTLQFIPKIDAAIFLLSADMPVSSLDSDFLIELKKTVPKIIFVMNKKDLLNEEDCKKLIHHDSKIIAGLMNMPVEEINFIAVSAREHEQGKMDSGIDRLKEEIQTIVAKEKTELLRHSAQKRYEWLHRQLMMQIQLKSDALQMPVEELKDKQQKLNDSITLMQSRQDEFQSIIEGKIKMLNAQVDKVVNRESRVIKNEIFNRLNGQRGLLNHNVLPGLTEDLNELLFESFRKIREELEHQTKEQFKNLLQEYSNRSQSFLNELATHLHSLLGINFEMIADKFDLDVYTSFYFTLDSGTAEIKAGGNILNRLFPVAWREKRLKQRIEANYNELIIRNSASVAYDITYRIQESFRKFSSDLSKNLDKLLIGIKSIIESTIEKREKSESVIEQDILDLKKRMRKMDLIKQL